jgi:adenosylcobinamide-phosphate synthase
LVGKVAGSVIPLVPQLAPDAALLIVAVAADLALGDPAYSWHPIRLVGAALTWTEGRLRAAGCDGYAGGILLFAALAAGSMSLVAGVLAAANAVSAFLLWIVHGFVLYSLLALGELVRCVRRIERAVREDDLPRARSRVSELVGRDTAGMDGPACRRAAVESLSENLTDGFVSPVFWYVIAGLPGVVVFKVVSTMDSMVGYKTPRYLRFGWCGARLDDVMNYLPARFTWLVIAAVAAMLPAFSGRKAWRVGLRQHGMLLGPNSGWSEAATAGALQRQIVGPIWLKDVLVTDLWIGDTSDPPLETAGDVSRAVLLAVSSGLAIAAAGVVVLLGSKWTTLR